MRICLYTETALPKVGGHEIAVDTLARQFSELGHEVVVLAPQPKGMPVHDQDLPYRVVRHPRLYSSRWFVSFYRRYLVRLYQRWPFDLLHCHGIYPPAWLGSQCRMLVPVPMVITSHGGDVYEKSVRLAKPVVKQRLSEALAAADSLISISKFTREGMLRLCPVPQRIEDIPNGIDVDAFSQQAPRPADLDAAIQPGRYGVFLGRLKARKGVDVLLSALAELPARGATELVIVGDGEERTALETQTQRLGLTRRVHFVGKRSGLEKVYLLKNALFGVVPSRWWEGLPLVVAEHFAAGLPVVATQVPGLGDMIEPGVTGLVVAPESSVELAGALGQMFEDPEKTRCMGQHANAAAQTYHRRTIAQRHIALFEELRWGRMRRLKVS